MTLHDPGERVLPVGRSFPQRVVAALRFDASVYDELEDDPAALGQAALVVALAGLARGVGAFGQDGWVGLVLGVLGGFIVWGFAAWVIWQIGVKSFAYTSDFAELLRTLGFAAAPLFGLALCALPLGPLRAVVGLAAHAAATVAFFIAARQALDVSTERALVVCVLAIGLSLVLVFLLSVLLVGTAASSATLPAL
ncbi:MAG: YIP1 family protein [Deltaproteobacteria bacterium]|nr:MAG: YIP1 family protein [Deltaproteobacteria bacterium]